MNLKHSKINNRNLSENKNLKGPVPKEICSLKNLVGL